MNTRIARTLLIAGGIASLTGLASCAKDAKSSATLPNPVEPAAAKAQARATGDNTNPFAQDALDIQAGFDQLNAGKDARPREGAPPVSGRQSGPPASSGTGIGANTPASVPVPSDAPAPKSKSSTRIQDKSPAQRRADAVQELASQLKPDIGDHQDPMRAAMPLIALDTISPASTSNELDRVLRAVTPDQQRAIQVTRDLMSALATDPDLSRADPAALARVFREKADALASAGPSGDLSIATVALCQRVEGFGRFTPLGTSTFLAGRPAAMIIYTEVQNFAQVHPTDASHPDQGADHWLVELGQTVELYLDSDGSRQMVIPEALVHDTAASRRNDFFLVQRVDLPRGLPVGNYNLKVAVRDHGRPTDAIAERIIPIRVVADASAIPDRRASAVPSQSMTKRQVAGTAK